MKAFVGVTDNNWFSFLSQQPGIDEVNFWQPSGKTLFKSLSPGELFLFKLHSPLNYIAGGGFFAHSSILPVSLAWEAFGVKNGAGSFQEMRRLIERRRTTTPFEDYKIGCIILTQPFFLKQEDWIPVPPDFSLNIVQGKTYDLTKGHGKGLWDQVPSGLAAPDQNIWQGQVSETEAENRYGMPIMITPRLGQGSFRVMVTDAYQRRCAITQEKILPALEAAHIKPFSESGPHKVSNGILLRSDIHRLFDAGYVTVTTDYRFEVSRKVQEDFNNGEHYRVFHGSLIHLPPDKVLKPSSDFLSWHNEQRYRG